MSGDMQKAVPDALAHSGNSTTTTFISTAVEAEVVFVAHSAQPPGVVGGTTFCEPSAERTDSGRDRRPIYRNTTVRSVNGVAA